VLLAPGNVIRFLSFRERCPNEATGFYAEDVRPFGFIVTKATPNGFSFTLSALSSNAAYKIPRLNVEKGRKLIGSDPGRPKQEGKGNQNDRDHAFWIHNAGLCSAGQHLQE